MNKLLALPLIAALSIAPPAMAADCHFANGDTNLYFLSPMAVAVDPRHGIMPYGCLTSSAGTGVAGRMVSCSDGYYGPLVYNEDETITFRDAVWKPVECPADDDVLDLMGN